MIKLVTIQNFEAHEDTTIEFGEGMNSIVGLSNSGKSSIVRALMMVVNNEWNKEMVRNGYDFCRVRIETERGWVEAERGEKVNRWYCKEGDNEAQLFQKVGTNVPDLATKILGMGKRERGNGISELPNFQSQLEKHYMLSEVGDKKATSNMIAVMMDNAIGLGGMEDLIKDFSADLLRDKKWLTEKQEQIADLKTGIVDEKIFSDYSNDVDEIGRMSERLEKMDSDINVTDKYMEGYKNVLVKSKHADERCDSIPETGKMESLYNELLSLVEKERIATKMNDISVALKRIEATSLVDVDSMNELTSRCDILSKTIALCAKASDCKEGIDGTSRISGIDCAKYESLYDLISKVGTRIENADKALLNAKNLWKQHCIAKKESEALVSEIKTAEKEFDELKDRLGVCPLCGNKL